MFSLNYRNIFLLRLSLQFSSSCRVQRIDNPQRPNHYIQPSSWVIVSSATAPFPLRFKYQTRVQSDHHKCLESDGHDLFKGISQRVYEEILANHEKPVSIFGYRAEITLGCLLYADLSHASWLCSACMIFHFRSKSCRPLSFCPHVWLIIMNDECIRHNWNPWNKI